VVVCVHCWGWISHEGAGVFHRIEGHLDGLHYQHILQNVTVPSVWIFHPDGIILLQQDHFSIHDSRVIQEWLSRQADLELFDWRRCDTSPVPVAGQSMAPRLLRLLVRIPRGHGCLSFVSGVCSEGYCQHAFNCLGYIQKYADSGTRTNIVCFQRLLLTHVQLAGLHKVICR